MAIIQKQTTESQHLYEVEKLGSLRLPVGLLGGQLLWQTVRWHQNIKNRVTRDQQLHCGAQSQGTEGRGTNRASVHMFIAAFFTPKGGNRPNCPSLKQKEYTQSRWERASVLPLPGPSHLGGPSSLQSIRAGTFCDVLAVPAEALLFLFLRNMDLNEVNEVVPKAALLASSTLGPLHQSSLDKIFFPPQMNPRSHFSAR